MFGHNTHAKGEIAQLKIEMEALQKGYLVSKPTRHESRYDCIIDDGVKLFRVQVKYADGKDSKTSGLLRIELKKSHKNHSLIYSSRDIDMILAYVPQIDKILVFMPDKFENKSIIYVRLKARKDNQDYDNGFEKFIW